MIIRKFGPTRPGSIFSIALSSDGKKVAVGLSSNQGFQVWNTASGKPIGGDANIESDVYGLSFSGSGKLAVSVLGGEVRLYDESTRLVRRVSVPNEPFSVDFNKDGSRLAVGHAEISKVDVLDGKTLRQLFRPNTKGLNAKGLSAVKWSGDGKYLFASGLSGQIIRWGMEGAGAPEILFSSGVPARLAAWSDQGIAFSGNQTGLIDATGQIRPPREPLPILSEDEAFLVSSNAQKVSFLCRGSQVVFDVGTNFLSQQSSVSGSFSPADITSLPISNWKGTNEPQVSGRKLALDPHEVSRDLAVLPNQLGFVLASDFTLRRFDTSGKQIWSVFSGVDRVNSSADGRILVGKNGCGMNWIRASDGKELLTLALWSSKAGIVDSKWVLWTPKGYYTASPGGEDLIGWHVNGKTWDETPNFYPASRFREKFYRPDIVQLVLDTLDEDAAINAANSIANRKRVDEDIRKELPPVINIMSPIEGSHFSKSDVSIAYIVRSPSNLPITSVDVLIDGRPMDIARRVKRDDGATIGSTQIDVSLPPHDVDVALIARTAGTASEPAHIKLLWDGASTSPGQSATNFAETPSFEKPKLYALLIGVSDYARSDLKLGYAAKDAEDMEAALKHQSGGLYGDVSTKLLIDKEASATSIRDGLDWLEKQVTSHDVGMVFLAGHGQTDLQQRFYFLPVDGDPDRLRATSISKSDFDDGIARSAGKIVLFLDACHAGQGISRERIATRGGTDMTQLVNELTSAETGIVMFASSQGRELSVENSDWKNGAFTKALVEGLSGRADYNNDGAISVKELDLWVSERVKELTDGHQHPVARRPDTMPDFPIAVAHR